METTPSSGIHTHGQLHSDRPLATELATSLSEQYLAIRRATEALCEPLANEDYSVQSAPEASPAKWHLAHTTWFFETFLLQPNLKGYRPFHPRFSYLFNSYYDTVGQRIAQRERGLLTRPTVDEVFEYRRRVDEAMETLFEQTGEDELSDRVALVELGLNHEQQHQELLLTDLKHAYWSNPLRPAYQAAREVEDWEAAPLSFLAFPEGVRWIGYAGLGFSYDNERPRHRVFEHGFQLASRLVTCGEYLAFVEEGGYRRPELWLSDGWEFAQQAGWRAPLYWEQHDGHWHQLTLSGMRPVQPGEPVCHVSYYEADAYARWAGARLPSEAEWETAATPQEVEGNFLEDGYLHPAPCGVSQERALTQLFGDAWEWTQSNYGPYPGFKPAQGAIGEYNGKFMINRLVLRGGSCVSPRSHLRATYRNFWTPQTRWQFSGIRLAKDT